MARKKILFMLAVACVVCLSAFPGIDLAGTEVRAETFSVTVQGTIVGPMSGLKVYAFRSSGAYAGLQSTTDSAGRVTFDTATFTEGEYRFRVDYLGGQFWSEVVHLPTDLGVSVRIEEVNVDVTVRSDSGPIQATRVYLFAAAGSYLGRSATTDAGGVVTFILPEVMSFKSRADYQGQQFWSQEFRAQDAAIPIPMARAEVAVTGSGLSLAGVKVYVFTAAGSYLGIWGTTDQSGMVAFSLVDGSYNFRADFQGNHFWGLDQVLSADRETPIMISTGGGRFALTVEKSDGDPLAGIKCYAFSESNSYLGLNGTTDDSGTATFNLADGRYKFRVDYLGYQYWSAVAEVPDGLAETLAIEHINVSLSVNGVCHESVSPVGGAQAYVFTESGNYVGLHEVTDSGGSALFYLPDQPYKIRLDYLGQQFWSEAATGQDVDVDIPMAEAVITVLGTGLPSSGVLVYLFSEDGCYLGLSERTNENGEASISVPQGNYRLRVDFMGNQYWSETGVLSSDQTNGVPISVGGGSFKLSVWKNEGVSLVGTKVYVFNADGIYLGISATTDHEGLAVFDLPAGGYKFRVDHLGYQFWTGTSDVPASLSASLLIPHRNVVVTVERIYKDAAPLPGLKTYLFASSGAYMGESGLTDENGQMVFFLPEKTYRVRVDYLNGQYWSDEIQFSDAHIAIHLGLSQVHVVNSGYGAVGTRVFVFNEAGTYLGLSAVSDDSGMVEFLLPGGSYKFRVDQGDTQYWSQVFQVTTGIINLIEVDISPTTANISASPESIQMGGSSTLRWSSTGTNTCVIEPGIGIVDRTGSISVSPAETTTFVITATGPGETAVAEITVHVEPLSLGPKLVVNPLAEYSYFGWSVSISGDYAIVGADSDAEGGIRGGAAYIFKRLGTGWVQDIKLVANNRSDWEFFGASVSISGDYAIVGAPDKEQNGSLLGAAYIYKREESGWTQQAIVTASDASEYSGFGAAVSIDGNYAIIGVPADGEWGHDSGAAYIFERDGSEWKEKAKLTASDASPNASFGMSVSISGDHAIVGALYDGERGFFAGAAYIFNRSGESWDQEAKLTGDDSKSEDFFGCSVSIHGDDVMVGAYGDDDNGPESGSVYFFKRVGTTWIQGSKLAPADGAEEEAFGWSVSIQNGVAVVGTVPTGESVLESGSAYVFKLSGSVWIEHLKVGSIAPSECDFFGLSVGLSGDHMIVGSPGADDGKIDTGSAYIFPIPILNVSVDRELIRLGQAATLTWNSTNAQSVVIEPGIGEVSPSGSITVMPSKTTKYTIVVTGAAGILNEQVTVYVVDPSVLPSATITAAPSKIEQGEVSTLSWTSSNAESCVIEPDIGEVWISGAVEVLPTEDTTYTITASGPAGTTTESVTISLIRHIGIEIHSPASGAWMQGPDVLIEGAIADPVAGEMGVRVNGVFAMVYAGHFVANHVPLEQGENTITVELFDSEGNVGETSITLNGSMAEDYIRISAEPDSGFAPMETVLKVDGTFDFTAASLTCSGPEEAEILTNTGREFAVRLVNPGVYYLTANAQNDHGQTFTDTIAIEVIDRAAFDAFLKTKWQGMRDALVAGDIGAAANFFEEGSRDRYEGIFTSLESRLPQVAEGLNNIQLIKMQGRSVEYDIRTIKNGKEYSNALIFVRDQKGLWKIWRF